MFDLRGKVALITGATGAIGGAISRTLHQMGATLALSGTKVNNLEALANELEERVQLFACNLNSAEDIRALVKNIERVYDRVDILVNNAGITRDNLLLRMSDEDWEDVMTVNLEAPFRLMKEVAKGMIRERWGRIINISSVVGAVGNAGQTNYSASKSGLFGLTKSAALELASRNITVNCIAPGFIESPMSDKIPESIKQNLKKRIPLGRIGEPEDIANAVFFFLSDDSSWITGAQLVVDGGVTLR